MRQSWACTWCKKPLTPEDIGAGRTHKDQVIPIRRGGPDKDWNRALLHDSCNRAKGMSTVKLRWLWLNCRDGSVGEQDAFAEQVGFRAAVHLSFDHLNAVDVAFDGAGTVVRRTES